MTQKKSHHLIYFHRRNLSSSIIQCNWLCYSRLFGDCFLLFGRKRSTHKSDFTESQGAIRSPSETTLLTSATPNTALSMTPVTKRSTMPATLKSNIEETLQNKNINKPTVDSATSTTTNTTMTTTGKVVDVKNIGWNPFLTCETYKTNGHNGDNCFGMDSTEWRLRGKEMVDFIADYLDTIGSRRVTPKVEPGYLKRLLPDSAPFKSESWDQIMDDFESTIMPGVTHWQHPRFHAYFPAGNAYPSILADMLTDAIGCIGFSWVRIVKE